MKARDKAGPFTTESYRNELAAASERFATTLRTTFVETGPRESRAARFRGEHLLWMTTFESAWHRHIGRTNSSTIH